MGRDGSDVLGEHPPAADVEVKHLRANRPDIPMSFVVVRRVRNVGAHPRPDDAVSRDLLDVDAGRQPARVRSHERDRRRSNLLTAAVHVAGRPARQRFEMIREMTDLRKVRRQHPKVWSPEQVRRMS